MKEKLLYRSIIRYIAGDREGAEKLMEQAVYEGRLMVPIREIIKAKGEIV